MGKSKKSEDKGDTEVDRSTSPKDDQDTDSADSSDAGAEDSGVSEDSEKKSEDEIGDCKDGAEDEKPGEPEGKSSDNEAENQSGQDCQTPAPEKPEASVVTESRESAAEASNEQGSTAQRIVDNRASLFEGLGKTLEYIKKVSDDKSLTFRDSDKTTANLLMLAFVVAVLFVLMPLLDMPGLALICYVLADLFLFMAILGFVLTRFGIIRAMEPRYALVTWHLMVGTGLMALTIGFNIVVIVVVMLMKNRFLSLFGAG